MRQAGVRNPAFPGAHMVTFGHVRHDFEVQELR
jgi:hypothetical protein